MTPLWVYALTAILTFGLLVWVLTLALAWATYRPPFGNRQD